MLSGSPESFHSRLPKIDPAIETQISHQAGLNFVRIGSQRIDYSEWPEKNPFTIESLPSLTFPPNPPLALSLKAKLTVLFIATALATSYLTYNILERYAGR